VCLVVSSAKSLSGLVTEKISQSTSIESPSQSSRTFDCSTRARLAEIDDRGCCMLPALLYWECISKISFSREDKSRPFENGYPPDSLQLRLSNQNQLSRPCSLVYLLGKFGWWTVLPDGSPEPIELHSPKDIGKFQSSLSNCCERLAAHPVSRSSLMYLSSPCTYRGLFVPSSSYLVLPPGILPNPLIPRR